MLLLDNKPNQKTMRKILLCALTALIMTSCYYPRFSKITSIGDFRKYTEAGFVVTPATSGYRYDPISEIQLTFYPGYKEGFKKEEQPKVTRQAAIDDLYRIPSRSKSKTNRGDWFVPDYDYMLAELVTDAQAMGATGILDLKIEAVYTYSLKNGRSDKPYKYIASGFAVKIK